jgi:hypothetical protein
VKANKLEAEAKDRDADVALGSAAQMALADLEAKVET